jgi:hypothetical protein
VLCRHTNSTENVRAIGGFTRGLAACGLAARTATGAALRDVVVHNVGFPAAAFDLLIHRLGGVHDQTKMDAGRGVRGGVPIQGQFQLGILIVASNAWPRRQRGRSSSADAMICSNIEVCQYNAAGLLALTS